MSKNKKTFFEMITSMFTFFKNPSKPPVEEERSAAIITTPKPKRRDKDEQFNYTPEEAARNKKAREERILATSGPTTFKDYKIDDFLVISEKKNGKHYKVQLNNSGIEVYAELTEQDKTAIRAGKYVTEDELKHYTKQTENKKEIIQELKRVQPEKATALSKANIEHNPMVDEARPMTPTHHGRNPVPGRTPNLSHTNKVAAPSAKSNKKGQQSVTI